MQLDQSYYQMKLQKQDEALSPWQSSFQNKSNPFITCLDQQCINTGLTDSTLTPSPRHKTCKQNQTSKNHRLQTNKLRKQNHLRWNSMNNLKSKVKFSKQTQSSKNLKNQLKKYIFDEEVSIQTSKFFNKTEFTPLNITNINNFSSIRSASARTSIGWKTCRLEVKSKPWGQKSPKQVHFQVQSDLSHKKVTIKQFLNQQWDSSTSMRVNLNRYLNNHIRKEVKLKPVCLKLKLNK